MVVLRNEFGGVLRDVRLRQGRTLREVSKDAKVSLGYLSEIERGQKEASSELLFSICEALQMPLSEVLSEVTDRVSAAEQMTIPDTIPANFYSGMLSASPSMRASNHVPTLGRGRVLGNRSHTPIRSRDLAPVA